MQLQLRNVGVELYRVLLMLGICFIHSFGIGGTICSKAVSSSLLFCVCGFVFISGYYGIRFRVSKFVSMYGLGAFAAAVSTILYLIHDPVSCGNILSRFLYTFRDYWFLNAYAVLMFLSPALNLITSLARTKAGFMACLSIMFCTIGWTFIAQLPILRSYVPQTPGIAGCSGFLFAGIYIFARLWREFDFMRFVMPFRRGGGVVIVALILTSIYPLHLGAYSSPFSIFVAAFLFEWFRHVKVPRVIAHVCVVLVPSLFSIYLLHTHAIGGILIGNAKNLLRGFGLCFPFVCIIIGMGLFFGCFLLDVVRRGLIKCLRFEIQRFNDSLDDAAMGICANLKKRLTC